MNCRKAEELIADRALGFIDSDRQQELDKHLAQCPKCRREAEEYSLAVQALKERDTVDTVDGLADTVLAWAGSAKRNDFRIIRLAVPALAAAAVLLMIVLSPVFFSNDSTEMTRLQILEAYAEDFEAVGIGSGIADYDVDFSYEDYGFTDSLSNYLIQ